MPGNIIFSKLSRKWMLSIDRVSLLAFLCIVSFGVWVSIASTPTVAMRLGLAPFYFVKHHVISIAVSLLAVIIISCMQPRHIRRLSLYGYLACLVLIACTLLFGAETKGARRWLSCFGMSVQPSEFIKPSLIVVTSWLISEQYGDNKFPGIALSAASILVTLPLLLLQPDIGMIVVITCSWVGQLFISGLSIAMIVIFFLLIAGSVFGLYCTLPHFADRIDKFCMKDGADTDVYQIQKSIEAFSSGGIFGKGPGEGIIKTMVPDAHSDLVFPVIAEEFGLIACVAVVALYVFFIARLMVRIMATQSIFHLSTVFGLLFQLGLQTLINIASSLDLIPTKGMTMPFISYGGSSFLASSIGVGILLALTKRGSAGAQGI